jgi:MarR family
MRDTAYKLRRMDGLSPGQMQSVRSCASDASRSILLLHHTVKGAWSTMSARREHSRGSSVLVGAADVQISLTQRDTGSTKPAAHFRLELVKARDFQAPPASEFTLSVHDGRGVVVLRPVEADVEETAREETEEELATRALSNMPPDTSSDTITLEELRRRLGIAKERVQGVVERLMAAGMVARVPNKGLRRTGRSGSTTEGN